MAKQDLGIKRLCPNCGAKYYDLTKTPPVCPKCGTVFVVATTKSRQPEVVPEPKEEEPAVVAPDPAVEVISLEEADEEIAGAKPDGEDDEDDEVEADDDDDTFLEEEEDEGDDVTGIIGEVDGEDD